LRSAAAVGLLLSVTLAAALAGAARADNGDDAASLLADLGSEDALTRGWAATRIQRMASPPVPSLTDGLGSTNPYLREGCAVALGMVGPAAREAVPALLGLLGDPVARVRSAAARAVGGIGTASPETVQALVAALEDADGDVIRAAVEALTRLGRADAAIPSLRRHLREGDEAARLLAVHLISRMGEPGRAAAPDLVAALARASHEMRYAIVKTLGGWGVVDRALPALLQSARAGDPKERVSALSLLGSAGEMLGWAANAGDSRAAKLVEPIVAAVGTGLSDPDFDVRCAAAGVLKSLGHGESALPMLRESLRSAETRGAPALWLVAKLGLAAAPAVPELRACLAGDDPSLRAAAIRALGAVGPAASEAVPALIDFLALPDEPDAEPRRPGPSFRVRNAELRAEAATALGLIGDARALPALRTATGDSNSTVRANAVDALTRLGGPDQALAELGARLADPDRMVRMEAVRALGEARDRKTAIPLLVSALGDEDDYVRSHAHAALTSMDDDAAVFDAIRDVYPGLTEAQRVAVPGVLQGLDPAALSRESLCSCLGSADPGLRGEAGVLLARLGDPACVPALMEALPEFGFGCPFAWEHAAGWLSTMGSAAVLALERTLREGSPSARVWAAWGLAVVHSSASVPMLVACLADPDAIPYAAWALGAIGDPSAASALSALADHPEPQVRRAVACALLQTAPSDGALARVLDGLDDPDPEVRRWTVSVLASTDGFDEPIARALASHLVDGDWWVRYLGVEALGQRPPAAAIATPAIVARLTDDMEQVRIRAAEALGRLGPAASSAVPDLIRRLRDNSRYVRMRAAEALARMGPAAREALPELRSLARDLADDITLVSCVTDAIAAIEQADGHSARQRPGPYLPVGGR